MQVIYFKDPRLNFGDDLNEFLWSEIFSDTFRGNTNITLVGIGSILSEQHVGHLGRRGEKIIVMGTGTSYDLPPKRMSDWSVLAVRGPLTANVIGMPEKSITDGAILLAAAPKLTGPAQKRTDIVFMPHHRTLRGRPWNKIAHAAGMTLVSPEQPVDDVLKAFGRAKLVVTEAMHGAIVADTLRIPWIPLIIAPTIDEFKWRDWSLSMDVAFAPHHIPAGDASDIRRYRAIHNVLARAGLDGHSHLTGAMSPGDLVAFLQNRYSKDLKSAVSHPLPEDIFSRMKGWPARLNNPRYQEKTARALERVALSTPYLSKDVIFNSRLTQMREAVAAAETIGRASYA
jgi:succinoglycan biosynthesis protein ExoV